MQAALEFLAGKKTYLVAAGVAVTALGAFAAGEIDLATAFFRALEAAGLATLRAGVSKV
jgi:hypothetical protein